MLSRTAANLYWMGRYVERADFIARLLDATRRLDALPVASAEPEGVWASAVATAGASVCFAEQGHEPTRARVVHCLAFDRDNPSSIRNCIENARTNARAVRTALTVEAWEALNSAWLDMLRLYGHEGAPTALPSFVDTIKQAVLAFDGAAQRSMLRNEAFWFIRLGQAIECADNSARLLDVKYHLLLPPGESVGGSLDHFQWTTILRTVSAVNAYRWVYRDGLKPWLVADLLILRREMPRSLAACMGDVVLLLDLLARQSGRRGLAHRLANTLNLQLSRGNIHAIFQDGLHEFLQGFIAENNRLGDGIAEQYLF